VRAGFGFGSALLSFSLREQILSEMRNLEDAEGVEVTRRWVELVDEGGDKGSGELVIRGGKIESADESTFSAKGAGDGRDKGGGLLRLLGRSEPTLIVLDFFRNPNLPLSMTLAPIQITSRLFQ